MANLKDVAQLAEVSISTASRVLNTGKDLNRLTPECIERVRAAADQLGYVPNYHAQSMQSRLAQSIGVALDASSGMNLIGNHYFSQIVSGIQAAASEAGFSLSIIGSKGEVSATQIGMQQIRQRRIDGLVTFGVLGHEFQHRLPTELELPMVIIEPAGSSQVPSVHVDMEHGSVLAVQHLADLGHKSLLWLGGRGGRQQAVASTAWEMGLQGRVCECANKDNTREATIDNAAQTLGRWMDANDFAFTAIICWNDFHALGAYRALAERGLRVPEDVSVIGFDDVYADLLAPPLTSVSHRLFDLGARAADLLLDMVRHPDTMEEWGSAQQVIEPTLSKRASTGPCPA